MKNKEKMLSYEEAVITVTEIHNADVITTSSYVEGPVDQDSWT